MKTKLYAIAAAFAASLLLPAAAGAQLKFTGARVFGIGADGKREGSHWDTVGNDGGYNVYLFTGSQSSPSYLNRANTDNSLNPNFNLSPGTYTFGFAGDTRPCPGMNLELCFNDDPQTRISVTTSGNSGQFSGTSTFDAGDSTVTLTSIQPFGPEADLVSPYGHRPNGTPDIGGTFTLVVAAKRGSLAPLAGVTLRDFKLTGDLSRDQATFTLTAMAKVENSKGGTLDLMSGTLALTELGAHPKWRVRVEKDRYVLAFDRNGEFPIQIKFNAAVRQSDGWNILDFRVAPTAMQRIILQGLAADTQFQFAGAARPERSGGEFVSYLPSDGAVSLSWKESRPEVEGKLFYAAEMLSQISVSPGLMRQVALLDFKVMQGEMNRVSLLLRGAGEVTRVQGDPVLAWNVEAVPGSTDRRLVVQLNQPQKGQFALQVQMQTPLAAFPQTADAIQIRPESAIRFAGYVRIVNEGAVRLEVAQASGMSQMSPEQFPETDLTRAALKVTGTQRFAYRFSGADFALRIQADQILPELAVSHLLAYHLGENELAIDAEIELEIREAPLRELLLRVPKGYVVAKLNASGLSDYFLRDPADQPESELRLVYGQPVSGRQLVQLRLERNQALGQTNWTLPRIEVSQARSARGFVGVSSDAGLRLTAERTQSLTDIATAFFPRKLAGIQAAFRLNDPAWQATLRVERLPQTVQADAFHLFSIGEGIAYGSSVMNYVVSGAPVSVLKVELSDEYFNVEFTGKDIRNWQKTEGGYLVQLHTPVSGPYTLLATYERPFKAQGETLAFTGARPLDAQSEQGHTLIISDYQFKVDAADVSSGLLLLEPGEVPPEYRLFFDAPILKAYRYAARPFNLKLALSLRVQGDSLSQVVDRASLMTRISKEGQVITDVRYFVKNRGNPNFSVTLPEGTQLWSATVNGATVVPVLDVRTNTSISAAADNGRSRVEKSMLIPLPQRADPDAVLEIQLKLATRSNDPERVTIAAPVVAAPVMLAEWHLEPDSGRRLIYRDGSLTPVGGVPDVSGFAGWVRIFSSEEAGKARTSLIVALVLVGSALVVWRWAARGGVHKYSARHLGGLTLGLVALVMAAICVGQFNEVAGRQARSLPMNVTFLAPVQQASSPLIVELENVSVQTSKLGTAAYVWPALIAVALWIYGWIKGLKAWAWVPAWTLLGWAALRYPNGAGLFLWVVAGFILAHVVIPAFVRLWKLPEPQPALPPAANEGSAAPAVTAWLVGGLAALLLSGATAAAADKSRPAIEPAAFAESVIQDIRIEDKFALVTAKIRWPATKGQILPVLREPAVLTKIVYPTRSLKLIQATGSVKPTQQLLAMDSGTFEVEVQYQLQITKGTSGNSFVLPIQSGLVNRVNLTVAGSDVDVQSPQAVSVQREMIGSNTVAKLVLSPADTAWVLWKPRSRDVKREKPVFYVDLTQLYVPSAGVIEGAHYAAIRPAQGELSELIFDVPKGATITDVFEAGGRREDAPASQSAIGNRQSALNLVSLWRFDPDTRKLRVTLSVPQSRPFALLVRSQVATGPLPFEQTVGLIRVDGAAGQIGLLGLATGNEVQLDTVRAEGFSPINLEDFPASATGALQTQVPGLTVRRALRYSNSEAVASLKASPVEPDVRVETQDTLSLGEDRTVLAANATVTITRAGIFRLSFVMPAGFDVESISGSALSHWTELKTDAGRVITLHLTGKTEGQRQFAISLSGPGVKATNSWTVPQLVLREASKQRGTLVIAPEQGMRLQVATREGVTQLDPQKSGIKQRGVLAFRVLQTPATLTLDVEQVDPWIQVTSLQHAVITEAQIKVTANLQYQIENTGLKAFRVLIPANAEGVHFQGDQVADFLRVPDGSTNGLQAWEVKLHRRVIGQYLLQVNYQTVLAGQTGQAILRGVEVADVNLQRGFVTVQSDARLQVKLDAAPAALQPAEWQSIPRALQQDLTAAAADFAFRLVDPSFQLPLKLERHEAAKLLPAHVNNITFNSVISDDGVMLTQVRLEILPGDMRLLNLTLPKDARFWFAFVNQNGVWPWREGESILIPLEQQSRGDKAVPVEVFYSCRTGSANSRALDLELLAPKFDLPLENLTWRVSLSEKWQVKYAAGSLQLQQQQVVPQLSAIDLQTYLQTEATWQRERTKEAGDFMAAANSALVQGDPHQARRAFQAAYGLSTHDAAFNEDARVQLHNIKLQQALVGLNVRQAAVAGNSAALGGTFRDLRNRKEVNYTQQDAKELLDRNTADDNAAFMRLAERLIQQQDAAVSSASALRANIPEQGRVLTFKRAVVVDKEADLRIALEAVTLKTASGGLRLGMLVGTLVLLAALAWAGRSLTTTEEKKFA
jgi:hypothetical protein